MNQLTLRPAREQDLPFLSDLLYQVQKVHSDARPDLFRAGGKKYSDAEVLAILRNPLTPVFVAEKDRQILGYAFCIHREERDSSCLTDIKTLYIDDLCVNEAARGEKVGTALYEYVLNYAREKGYYNVTLNVWADNQKALHFYEKLGLHIQKIGMEKIL